RRTRAGSCRFFAPDELCGSRSQLRSILGSILGANRGSRGAFRGNCSNVESAVRIFFGIAFAGAIFSGDFSGNSASCGFGKSETKAALAAFRRSGACGIGENGTGRSGTARIARREEFAAGKGSAQTDGSRIRAPGLFGLSPKPAEKKTGSAGRLAHARA